MREQQTTIQVVKTLGVDVEQIERRLGRAAVSRSPSALTSAIIAHTAQEAIGDARRAAASACAMAAAPRRRRRWE